MKKLWEFIVIDDDENTNLLCGIIIKQAIDRDTIVKTFTSAENGINYLKAWQPKPDCNIIIFLDINMPVTTGWDALNMIQELDDSLTKQLTIFMLTSSIDPNDKKRAIEHPLVLDFIEKPLTVEKIQGILDRLV